MVILIISSRIFFALIAILASVILSLKEGYLGQNFNPSAPYLIWIWANFDGVHFLDIASKGYNNFDFAFFPLYPLFIYIFSKLLHVSELISGILLSLIFLIFAIKLIYKIILLDFNEKIAKLTVIFLLFSPLAFFYHSVYTESLFLLTTTGSLFFARKKMWLLSGIFGMMAVLTRLSGISLIPALVAEWYMQNRSNFNFSTKVMTKFFQSGGLAVFLCGGGLILYMLYLKIFFGDPLLFQKSMVAWSQSSFVLLPQVIYRYLKIFISVDPSSLVYQIAMLEFFSFFLYVWLALYVLIKIRVSYGVYMIILLTLVTFTGTFAGTPRYITHLFPAYLALAYITNDNKLLKVRIAILFVLLGSILTALFTRGNFIT